MILDIYKDAFEYSAQDIIVLLKLGVIYLLSFLIFPAFLVLGYSYRVTKIAVNGMINGGDEVPEFNDIVGMFVEGIQVFIVNLVYSLIPMIIFFIFVYLAFALGKNGAPLFVIGFIISFIVGIFAYLFSMIGIAHMANNDGEFSSAFRFEEIKEIIESIGWGRVIGTYLGMIIMCFALSSIISFFIYLIFGILGISTCFMGFSNSFGSIFGVGVFISFLVTLFIVGPYLMVFQSRTSGLLYNLH